MVKMGLPVPPGFTISTEVCTYFYASKKKLPSSLAADVKAAILKVEKSLDRKFGDPKNPLLVSVRSGARASMPGMMDTILNLGLNDRTVLGLAESSNDARFAYDSYRRFISMYADVVLNIHSNHFEGVLEELKHSKKVDLDSDLTAEDLKVLVQKYKQLIRQNGESFPEDPWKQLDGAIQAVLNSWMSPRAITYRRLNDIPESWGTAVNVQAMVFGNMGDKCATGVAFTRDPSSGERKFFGEFLLNAQGEDVVSGVRTPNPINNSSKNSQNGTLATLEESLPKAYTELVKIYQRLEKHYKDMQDIEFTIEKGKLFILQTRTGKRTAAAAIRIAVEMVEEKLITPAAAVMRVTPDQLDQLLHPRLDPKAKKDVVAKGLPASPGAASGQVVFDPDTAERWVKEHNKKVLLIRMETSPEDIHGMSAAQGILTARGGMTSHAAVVARGMGKCCVAGCSSIKVNLNEKNFSVGGRIFREGDWLTLDGSSGEVIVGQVPTVVATLDQTFQKFMKWVDQIRRLGVRANADTPNDAKVARNFGAEGIGLCRTEHMFFDPERIDAVREMILAETRSARERALEKILPMQRKDFEGIFREMAGLPVTIRLLDPPLHEFIPQKEDDLKNLAQRLGLSFSQIQRKSELLHEFNPMLGHRGCRLGISYPEIYETQIRAIIEAACYIQVVEKTKVFPEIMIPLVGDPKELQILRASCLKIAADTIQKMQKSLDKKFTLDFTVGTMIELPRAALLADRIAEYADFFSYGTNDLTQTTYGLSRDDSGNFLRDYLDQQIYEKDPFSTLDPFGVGELILISARKGKAAAKALKKNLKLGICGEHGGDPASIHLCDDYGLDYVSCSPYRVPIARLAAAQATLKKAN